MGVEGGEVPEIDGLPDVSVKELLVAIAGPECHLRISRWVKVFQIHRQHLAIKC